jgi:hypothetical protein
VAEASTPQQEALTEQQEESLTDQQRGASTEAGSPCSAEIDRERQSGDSGDSETASNNSGHLKVSMVAALAGISYNFGPSKIMKTRIGSMESYARYFLKGYAPGAESEPEPRVNEAVIFEDFFCCRASYATASSPYGYSAQILSATAPFVSECYCSYW